jgi:hypothetical protein
MVNEEWLVAAVENDLHMIRLDETFVNKLFFP